MGDASMRYPAGPTGSDPLERTMATHAQLQALTAGLPELGDIDRLVDQGVGPVTEAVKGVVFYAVPVLGAELPLIVVWLVACGVFFTASWIDVDPPAVATITPRK